MDFLLTKGRVSEDELIADASEAGGRHDLRRELPAENPDRDHLDEDDNNCCGDVIYILHASMSATVNFSIGLKFNFNRDVSSVVHQNWRYGSIWKS